MSSEYTLRIMAIHMGQAAAGELKIRLRGVFLSNSRASLRVGCPRTAPPRSCRQSPPPDALRSLPGVTASENWPRYAGAMSA